MTKFDFTEAELKSNKNGFFSQRQKDMLNAMAYGTRKHSQTGVWVILGFSFLGLCLMFVVGLQSMDARRLQSLGPQMLAGLCFTAFAVSGMIALMLFLSKRQAAKLESPELLSVEGVVRHDSSYSESGSFTSYYVYFGKKWFAYVEDMSHVFPEGSTFRVYYCKAGQIELILSFEKLA